MSQPVETSRKAFMSAEQWFLANRGERPTWAETEIEADKFHEILGWMEAYAQARCVNCAVSELVLSLFPGIGLLDRAFEEEGFCVVRGPDLLWGGDVRRFYPPAGVFAGIIGGPPCQGHSRWAGVNRKIGNVIAEDLIPEYKRCVVLARPHWWLLENVPGVPDVEIAGYETTRRELDMRWLGEPQSRLRSFQFGSEHGVELHPEIAVFEHQDLEPACLASEGKSGQISNSRHNGQQRSVYHRRRDFGKFCELQGLPADFLDESPFTQSDKYRVVGNGVPLPMGRSIAKAVKAARGP